MENNENSDFLNNITNLNKSFSTDDLVERYNITTPRSLSTDNFEGCVVLTKDDSILNFGKLIPAESREIDNWSGFIDANEEYYSSDELSEELDQKDNNRISTGRTVSLEISEAIVFESCCNDDDFHEILFDKNAGSRYNLKL